MSRREDVWSNTWSVNPTATNRFSNLQLPYNYNSASSVLDQLLNQSQSKLQATTANNIAKAKGSTASRLYSQGITGGSQFNDTVGNSGNDILDNSYDAFTQLGMNRLNQSIPLMQQDNANTLNIASAAQNVDQQNIQNALSKMGLLNNQVNSWEQMDLTRDSSSGTWDDIFAGLGIGAQIAGIPLSGGTTVLSSLLSDRRLKDNIKKVGISPKGTNIYEFNYIGNPKKFIGVMADEVPWASVDFNGIKFVDYNKVDVDFREA